MANERNDVDYIIIGQGLAGTCLSYSLLRRDQKILVVDIENGKNCSAVAVGAYNPLAFRTFSPTWKAAELVPEAREYYLEMGTFLKTELVNDRPILKVINNEDQIKLWFQKSERTESSQFMQHELLEERQGINTEFGLGKVLQSGNINMPELLENFRSFLKSTDQLLETQFNKKDLQILESGIVYKNIRAKGIIFCEGHEASENPYFNELPFKKSKGEVIIVKCLDLKMEEILHNRINIVPIGNDLYWVGSTYEWEDMELKTTEDARSNLEKQLRDTINLPFKVIEQKVGIRHTVKDRRPVLGRHPHHSSLYIFNGLGTRGVMLGPHFSKQLCAFLLDDKIIEREVDYLRFIESK